MEKLPAHGICSGATRSQASAATTITKPDAGILELQSDT